MSRSKSFLDNSPAPLGANLYADVPQVKPDLDFVRISDKVGSAVVKIECDKVDRQGMQGFDGGPGEDFWERFFGNPGSPRQRPSSQKVTVQGTGFFICADGYILTNNHIVENGQKVKVFTVPGDEYPAKIIGTDPPTDLALIKVEARTSPSPSWAIPPQVKVGEWVLAIGNPLGHGAHRHGRHRQRQGPPARPRRATSQTTRTSSRPTRPSTGATPAARWST